MLAAAAAPRISKELAHERFAPVLVIRQLPAPLWEAVKRFTGDAGMRDAGYVTPHLGDKVIIPPKRTFAVAGVGSKLDFVIYEHHDHDHLLVFRRLRDGERPLAFSCRAKALPRKATEVSTAVARGGCREESGPVETD